MLFGKGDGTFPTGADYVIGIRSNLAAIGDLDGDGRLDMVADTSTSTVGVLLGSCQE